MKRLLVFTAALIAVSLPGCGPNATVGENANKFFEKYCADWARCPNSGFTDNFSSAAECQAAYVDAYAPADIRDKESKGGNVNDCLRDVDAYCPEETFGPLPPAAMPQTDACQDLFKPR